MKIGILETGKPPAPLAKRFGRYPAMFEALLGADHAYTTYDVEAGGVPTRADEQDAYIVTGSPAGVYEELAWIGRLLDFLRAAKGRAKLVGICFGHQAMAQAFGGKVEKSANGWGAGLHRYYVIDRAFWMDDASSIAIPVSHQDQVVVQPPNSRLLARSVFNPYGVLEYEDQPAISFQCHPEFEPGYARALIELRRDRIERADEAIASLAQPNDRARVAGWIRRFLSSPA